MFEYEIREFQFHDSPQVLGSFYSATLALVLIIHGLAYTCLTVAIRSDYGSVWYTEDGSKVNRELGDEHPLLTDLRDLADSEKIFRK